ncbi:TOMM precursor leader peptide-binding protein [Allokutzneria sp. A3M-2-11 16]|uniref:TOMM precursor leader peptide-binding protein n=1 Tax=Allokutzneria sp. A3M-2-11 16 TaxID=2962043 RepID=UPI0020B7F1D4|nr:TOMM precursor leader peptide-binding protein [Allokutzneria sp. A3M-2-11 16]MCP3801373.1 TOMM precursor leader peptide-binding protein [Allokutzneria sp. A3M-2-11 16]
MGEPITVLGKGLLAETITDFLSAEGEVSAESTAIVVATDGWDTRDYASVRERKLPWLPVRAELGRVVIGPVELPGEPGCAACAELRRRLARKQPRGHDAVLAQHGDTLADTPSSWLTPLAADLVAALVGAELANPRQRLLYVDLETLRITEHRFLPDPRCPDCGTLPADSAELARIVLRPQPKPAPEVYRVRPVTDDTANSLIESYVDSETGIIRALYRGGDGGLALASAPMGLRSLAVESGYGRTRSYRASELTAVLEALERYGGVEPGGRDTVIMASYNEIREHALDPNTLGAHPAESYAQPGFRFAPFDPDAEYRWVWGYSFARQEPILVPEAYAYYRAPRPEGTPAPFVYEISNGCALGGCLEEAIFYGILEVAERDAFLMTWYARMGVPRIDPESAADRTVPALVRTLEAETGYHVSIFDITLEQRVPSIWAMAVDEHDRPGHPKVVCAAGSHPDPERAAENALSELGPILSALVEAFPEQARRARAMAADPELVADMPDHALASGDPSAFARLDFLVSSARRSTFADLPRGFGNADLTDDLRELVGRYLADGMDVVVVDQTTPEHAAGDLACVKVIIPGTLPMTFGHRFRRVDGLPRLREVPHRLGMSDRPLTAEEINPDPHPFP